MIWRILITQRNCLDIFLQVLCFGFSSCVSGFCDFCAWLYTCSPAQMYPVCVPHVCFWQSILGVHSAAAFVCACACEANGGLLSGQRWIWGSLGPWSVQAFTLTPSMWARACVLSGCEWDVVCVCLSTCMFFLFFQCNKLSSCRHLFNVFEAH